MPIEIGPRETFDFFVVDRLWHVNHEFDTQFFVDAGDSLEILPLKFQVEAGKLIPLE